MSCHVCPPTRPREPPQYGPNSARGRIIITLLQHPIWHRIPPAWRLIADEDKAINNAPSKRVIYNLSLVGSNSVSLAVAAVALVVAVAVVVMEVFCHLNIQICNFLPPTRFHQLAGWLVELCVRTKAAPQLIRATHVFICFFFALASIKRHGARAQLVSE